ncbi:MAG: CRISPR-associated RAMP protein [Acidobacteria bacterium]|nr:MAG: CRISPR-associated RAMP protein [Acidobacteriota bacterium]
MSELQEPAFLDVFKRRLRLEGRLVTRTGLHIGAGGSGDPLGTDLPVVRDAAGRPFIPGSSLKGVMRSAAEALLRSLPRPRGDDPRPRLWTCDAVGGDPCIDDQRVKALRKDLLPEQPSAADQRLVVEAVWEESCTICRFFGSLALASRVRFPDLPLAGELLGLEVRNGVGIDRDKELAADGVLYDFEAVPPGTGFDLTVIADNYADFEIGLLLYLFDELHRGHLALGGKTSRGLGQMRVEWRQMEETSLAQGSPFARLLSRQQLLAEEEEEQAPELPLPESGDVGLWRRLAERLDPLPEVDAAAVGRVAKDEGWTKAEINERLALGLAKPRSAWKEVLSRLVQCGRLVERDGALLSAGRAPAAESREEAAIDPRLVPIYDRFVGAVDARFKEVA